MDKFFFEAFQKLPNLAVPDSLQSATLRSIALRRYVRIISAVTFLCLLAFLLSVWHLYMRLADVEIFSVIKALAGTFELSLDSVTDSAKTLFQFLPAEAFALSALNLLAFACMAFLLRAFAKMQKHQLIA